MIYRFSILGLIAAFTPIFSQGQSPESNNRAVVYGKIIDGQDNSPVAGANICIRDLETGASSGLDGNFEIVRLPPGSHTVELSAVGYAPQTRADVMVSNVRPVELNFVLETKSIELKEVKVGSGYLRRQPDLSISTTSQRSEEIRRLPGGFEDVARAVSILPGIAQVGPGRNDLIVRGGAPSGNLYLIDKYEIAYIDRYWMLQNINIITYIDIQNVYNNSPKSPPRWDDRKREAVVPQGIGILPSIGFSLEF